ncbi:hypothetical protein M422DRAFT_28468 [Sphaerobolus stellatus SS14]|nr:hypothetical protein M422DRAFT_28468 [Sphaerobolus stellatus SS14]
MSFSVNDAIFVGTILEGFFYGLYLVIFVGYVQATRESSRKRMMITTSTGNKALYYPLCVLFVLATIYFAFDFVQQFFTIMRDGGSSILVFRVNILNSAIFAIVDCMSQMILIYRCYIVWSHNRYIVILPILMSITSLLSSLILAGELGVFGTNPDAVPPGWFLPLGTAGFSISLAVNAIVTMILVGRIWMLMRQSRDVLTTGHSTYLHPIMLLLIESGVFTLAGQMCWVIFFKLQTPPWFIIGGPLTMIYGITPTLLAARVALGKTYETRVEGASASTQMGFKHHTTNTGLPTNNDMDMSHSLGKSEMSLGVNSSGSATRV